jgi:DNA modification methylase/transcriptional regulator with XRE-family HTH domain
MTETTKLLTALREEAKLSEGKLAELLGTSLVWVTRWQRGAASPSPALAKRIAELYGVLVQGGQLSSLSPDPFASRGVRTHIPGQGDLWEPVSKVSLSDSTAPPIISRLTNGKVFKQEGEQSLVELFQSHRQSARTATAAFSGTVSAGKNTYTYDAHTYHTKVPPQGIAELMHYYLPHGGLALDPFSGSGMTGVAASVGGFDCILNELSPAACFISDRFTTSLPHGDFEAAVRSVLQELEGLRRQLYLTTCRECGKTTELLYMVWSYRVICNGCDHEFVLWDHCRKYGKVVREHKILSEFPCPACGKSVRKSRLKRTAAEPVLVGYKCCGSRQQEKTHVPSADDLQRIANLEASASLAEGFYPHKQLPDGVNLRQPAKHGLDRIDKFYTRRNLVALSHIWKTIHRVDSPQLAGHLAFVFTSLYQRVTRLSEFRFWGGSGNTAVFNVPFIFDEPNVFVSFARKARTIQDHLESTASAYKGRVTVVNGSATSLNFIPDESIDFIFTDPPFGANINYSEMNLLWESWLGCYTDNREEAIMNRIQGKGVAEYEQLMAKCLNECARVLRPGHWMLLVFMNSSKKVWTALRNAISAAGFDVTKIDIFDKQHGTFKQFVSENTAGMDLVLHCLKPKKTTRKPLADVPNLAVEVIDFLKAKGKILPTNTYLHVGRNEETDFRTLYSEWMSHTFVADKDMMDFAAFRQVVQEWLHERKD